MSEIDLPAKMSPEEGIALARELIAKAEANHKDLDYLKEWQKIGAKKEAEYWTQWGFPSHVVQNEDGDWEARVIDITPEARRFISDLPTSILKSLMKTQDLEAKDLDRALSIWHRSGNRNGNPHDRRSFFWQEWSEYRHSKTRSGRPIKGQLQLKIE